MQSFLKHKFNLFSHDVNNEEYWAFNAVLKN